MKRSSIMLMLVAMIVAVMAGIGSGRADTCNSAGSCESDDNQVTCASDGVSTGVAVVSAGSNGAEVCNDGSQATPIQGRIGAEGPTCDCVYADGDADNMAPLDGWVRIDQNGVACTAGETSYNGGPGGACA